MLISACNSPFTTVKEPTVEPEPAALAAPQETSTWEHAYGEPQETQENISVDTPSETIAVQAEITPKPVTDLWQRIREGYGIDHPTLHKKTQSQLTWFVKHPDYIDRVVERARPYLHHIVDEIEQRNMPLEIALLPIVESGFQPFAYSHGRAAGLWQFIPGTGKVYGWNKTGGMTVDEM